MYDIFGDVIEENIITKIIIEENRVLLCTKGIVSDSEFHAERIDTSDGAVFSSKDMAIEKLRSEGKPVYTFG